MDVLEMWNGFRPVLDVIRKAQIEVNANGTNFVISIDPKNMSARSVAELEKVSDEIICSSET
jgi:hypothetical protein